MVAVAGGLRERRALTGAQQHLALVVDEDELALEHIDELVLVRMPMALARPSAGRQAHEIDAEVDEAAGVAEPLPDAFGAGRGEGLGVA